jgi:hypothetical protein
VIFLLLIIFSNTSSGANIDNPVSLESFNNIWIINCKDTGERSIDAHINIVDASPKLLHGYNFVVSDHFTDRSYKCYRMSSLRRVIISGSIYQPQLTYVKNHLTVNDIYALYDYISSDLSIDVQFYDTSYDPQVISKHVIYIKNKKKYAIESTHNVDFHKFESYVRILMMLEPKSSNTFHRNVLSEEVGKASYYPNGSTYIFSGDKVTILGRKIGSEIDKTIGNFVERKLKFTATSDNTKDNLIKLVDSLGKSFNSFNGFIEGDFYNSNLDVKWLQSWINGNGYLTQENKKKILLSNKKRLYTWLSRYIKKHHYAFKKGEIYYFSKDLGHYLLMDYYKGNGSPIYTGHREDPCIKFKKDFSAPCTY